MKGTFLIHIRTQLRCYFNSLFGFLGSHGSRYCHSNFSEAITLTGQLIIKWCEKHLNDELNSIFKTTDYSYVIASDTDSLIVNYESIIKKFNITDTLQAVDFLEKFSKKIEPVFQKILNKLSDEMNMYDNRIYFKLEKVCDHTLYLGKKHYVLSAWSSEGTRYKEPKVVIKGMEAVKTSTPTIIRNQMKITYKDLLYKTNDETLKNLDIYRDEYMKSKIEDISFPRGCNGIEKYGSAAFVYIKGTPMHTRAALLYNHLIDKHKLGSKYPKIIEGQKIKFVYLKVPNPLGEDIIGFINQLPPEFDLHPYVDYNTMYVKSFLDPIHNMMKAISWKTTDEFTLEDF